MFILRASHPSRLFFSRLQVSCFFVFCFEEGPSQEINSCDKEKEETDFFSLFAKESKIRVEMFITFFIFFIKEFVKVVVTVLL